MKPRGRSSDSRMRHPSSGSARWCSTPDASTRSKVLPSEPRPRMSAWPYSMLVRPSARVLRTAKARLARLRSTASTLAPANLCAVSIACWPVPQPAIRMSVRARPRGSKAAAGNRRRRYWSKDSVSPGGSAFAQRGYGFSSYCRWTSRDTSSSTAVSTGMDARNSRSCAGSPTCWASRSATAADHSRSRRRSAPGSEWSGK